MSNELKPGGEHKPSNELKPAALSEDEARAAINRWNDRRHFHIKYLGDKIFIDDIVPHWAYTVRLQTQYERRAVSQETEPFPGGPVDDRGRPPGPWEIPVRRPTDFEDHTERLPVPHTERVVMCDRCAGQGRIDCSRCNGTGKAVCPWCGGSGYRQRMEMRSQRDASGNVSTQPVTLRENCTCYDGRVTCTACSGNGRRTCPNCAGSGRVKTYELLTVLFRAAAEADVLDPTPVPDNLLGDLTGDTLVDERAPRIERVSSGMPDVDRRVEALLAKSQDVNEREVKILFQHVHVERLTIQDVIYKYAGVERHLWISGKEQHVHALGAPYQWQKLMAVVAGAVVGVIGLVVLAVLFYGR